MPVPEMTGIMPRNPYPVEMAMAPMVASVNNNRGRTSAGRGDIREAADEEKREDDFLHVGKGIGRNLSPDASNCDGKKPAF
jgi:hypothetical protein